jgi:hypothetical protein
MSSGLQNKMLNYEVIPPAGVWEKIAEALDESELAHEFPSKLYEAEIIPPVAAWNKIATSLDAEHEAAIPERRKFSPVIKYAAAAVVIGLIAWGGIRLLNNKSGKNDLAKLEIIPPEKDMATPQTNPAIDTTPEDLASANNNISSEEARNDAALEASKKTFAKLDIPINSRLKEIAAGYHFASSVAPEDISGLLYPDIMTNTNDLSACYITLMTPEGHIIRISNKLSDLACCVSGEEEDEECKYQMKKWREKILSSPASHSTGGFMDILGLVKALQEN